MCASSTGRAELSDLDTRLALFHLSEDDDNGDEESRGEVVGIEIDDFLDFDQWDALPALAELWQAPGRQPLPVADLFKQLQAKLRAEARSRRRSERPTLIPSDWLTILRIAPP